MCVNLKWMYTLEVHSITRKRVSEYLGYYIQCISHFFLCILLHVVHWFDLISGITFSKKGDDPSLYIPLLPKYCCLSGMCDEVWHQCAEALCCNAFPHVLYVCFSPFYGEDFYFEIPRPFQCLSFYVYAKSVFQRDLTIGQCIHHTHTHSNT